jgi:hypothetical protein
VDAVDELNNEKRHYETVTAKKRTTAAKIRVGLRQLLQLSNQIKGADDRDEENKKSGPTRGTDVDPHAAKKPPSAEETDGNGSTLFLKLKSIGLFFRV